MSAIHSVKLELLRPGPAHNQLLSPLTPYLALCGSDGPVTVQMPFEQRQLLARLQRLHYEIRGTPVEETQRESELSDMGEAIGRVLAQIPALLADLSSVRGDSDKLVHLRLAMSAFELGLVPFEAAVATDGFPGAGSPLFLQSRLPIVLTREVRKGRPLPLEWNRPPRILFAFASPPNLPKVPAQAHLEALRRAIEPWIKIKDDADARIQEVKKRLTVIPNASLEAIRQACANETFTHVHLLAHGAPLPYTDERRYGIVLCGDGGGSDHYPVDGKSLAFVLTTHDASGRTRSRPNIVTLASCDSGDVGSVLTPGGSIAHELHAADIPWVFASQFPLWMRASTLATEILYSRLLAGIDPRLALYELRQRLRSDFRSTHDWASIVAYASVPRDFELQVHDFSNRQTRAALDVKFDRVDQLVEADDRELDNLFQSIRAVLKAWREDSNNTSPKEKAERLGMSGASEKRLGIAYFLQATKRKYAEAETARLNSKKAYSAAQAFYRKALETDPTNHWVLTQYLSLLAIPELAPTQKSLQALKHEYGAWWVAARQIARLQLTQAHDVDRSWPLASLAELCLLGVIYGDGGQEDSETEITDLCRELLVLAGKDSFPVQSTLRQMLRYREYWHRKEWDKPVTMALAALGYRKTPPSADEPDPGEPKGPEKPVEKTSRSQPKKMKP